MILMSKCVYIQLYVYDTTYVGPHAHVYASVARYMMRYVTSACLCLTGSSDDACHSSWMSLLIFSLIPGMFVHGLIHVEGIPGGRAMAPPEQLGSHPQMKLYNFQFQ